MAWTKRRLLRALGERLSRYALVVVNQLAFDARLSCNACGRATTGFSIYEGRPYGCPNCRSSSRERFVLELLDAQHLFLPGRSGRVLHCAPSERALSLRFQQCGEYVAGDFQPELYRDIAVKHLDLTTLSAETWGSFSLIYASHVLEHIPDDKAAMGAVFNVLKPGGEAWFLVPLREGPTLEPTADEQALTPTERETRFGQWDHVRFYGDDFADRLKQAGFQVEILAPSAIEYERAAALGLNPEDRVFRCLKPAVEQDASL